MKKLSHEERLRRVAELDLTSAPVQRVLRVVTEKRIVIDDTLALYELLHHSEEENAKNEPGIAKLPRELRGSIGAIEPPLVGIGAAAFGKWLALLGELHKRGVTIVAGLT